MSNITEILLSNQVKTKNKKTPKRWAGGRKALHALNERGLCAISFIQRVLTDSLPPAGLGEAQRYPSEKSKAPFSESLQSNGESQWSIILSALLASGGSNGPIGCGPPGEHTERALLPLPFCLSMQTLPPHTQGWQSWEVLSSVLS